jgi:hypothetical protein
MGASRREFLVMGGAAAAVAAAPRALADWQPSQRYPDPAVRAIDPSFARYQLSLAKVERLGTGFRWCEGPVVRGRALPPVERHPERPDDEVGGDGCHQRLPKPSSQLRQHATARAGSSPASTTRGG